MMAVSERWFRAPLRSTAPTSATLTLFSAALGVALVTLVTCYVPARRTLKIDPARLLRQE